MDNEMGLSRPCDPKIKTTVYFSPRTDIAISKEARRLGISFGDVVRRITDAWVEVHLQNEMKVQERILVLDRAKGELRAAR